MKFLLLIFALVTAATPRLPAELVVHLPFDRDGTAANNSQIQAQAHPGASVDSEGARLGKGTAKFDGKDGYFHLAMTPALSNEARSVSLWIQSATPSMTKPNKVFLGWGGYGNEPGVRFDLCLENEDDRRLRLEFNAGNFVVSGGRPGVSLTDGQWHHVAAVYDSEQVFFYLDGHPLGDPVKPPLTVRTIGSHGTSIGTGVREAAAVLEPRGRFFGGRIDDLGIWNSALSARDVMLIYALAQVGDNDLRWLPAARQLWERSVGTKLRINGVTWTRVTGLPGRQGEWTPGGRANSAGSFIVLDGKGGGLQITPRWWENRAVRLGGVVGAGMAALALVAWFADRIRWRVLLRRLEAKEKAEQERRRISQDLHDDLGARLVEIILLGEKAREGNIGPPDLNQHIGTMTDKAHALVTALDEAVWTVNPEHDSLPSLADYLSGYAQEFLQHSPLHCRLDIARNLPPTVLAAKSRRSILAAVKEALNNAVRHSGGSEVWLRLRREDGVLIVAVEDNGRGMNEADGAGKGNGLHNMRKRMETLGGSLEISKPPPGGTTIQFRIPLKDGD